MTALELLTNIHVAISLLGIGSGFVVAYGFLRAARFDSWTLLFLSSNIATSVTGYFFPFTKLLPSHVFGVLALIVLALAVQARYRRRLAGRWRSVYIVSSLIALYLNVFVLVVQVFGKVAVFRELAPTQSEPPFLVAQTSVLAAFVILGVLSLKRFRGEVIQHP